MLLKCNTLARVSRSFGSELNSLTFYQFVLARTQTRLEKCKFSSNFLGLNLKSATCLSARLYHFSLSAIARIPHRQLLKY